jgi:hypothetical protein
VKTKGFDWIIEVVVVFSSAGISPTGIIPKC